MRTIAIFASALALSAATYGIAPAAESMPASIHMMHGMLTGEHGMTLYTFDNDKTANKSSCNGNCLKNWPKLAASASDHNMGDWTVITRDDGSKQWALKGKPLYYYSKDTKEGDTKGDNAGRGMVWHVAKM
jgi:predicted lipoprotein with Yx(FWY)xxD motif